MILIGTHDIGYDTISPLSGTAKNSGEIFLIKPPQIFHLILIFTFYLKKFHSVFFPSK